MRVVVSGLPDDALFGRNPLKNFLASTWIGVYDPSGQAGTADWKNVYDVHKSEAQEDSSEVQRQVPSLHSTDRIRRLRRHMAH